MAAAAAAVLVLLVGGSRIDHLRLVGTYSFRFLSGVCTSRIDRRNSLPSACWSTIWRQHLVAGRDSK